MRECVFSNLFIVSMFTLFVCVHFTASYHQHLKFINNKIKINTHCYDVRQHTYLQWIASFWINYIRDHSIDHKTISNERFQLQLNSQREFERNAHLPRKFLSYIFLFQCVQFTFCTKLQSAKDSLETKRRGWKKKCLCSIICFTTTNHFRNVVYDLVEFLKWTSEIDV